MITSITEKEFRLWYPGKEHVWELLNTKPRTEGEFMTKYLPSKLWRLNNLYYIVNKEAECVLFKMNRAQFFVYSHLAIHPRLIILKSRQQGISTLFLISYADDAIFIPNLNCGLMAQDKDAASLLLERTKVLWDRFDPAILDYLGRRSIKQNTEEMAFNNKSTIFIRTSFRSATLHRLHVSELGKIANKFPEKAKEVNTGTLQALARGCFGTIESTAEGDNLFKTKWDSAVTQSHGILAAKDFMPVFLPWLDDPDCVEEHDQPIDKETRDYFSIVEAETGRKLTRQQKNFWVAQKRELAGDIHQEYPATPREAFSAAKDGTYWALQYLQDVVRRRRQVKNLYEPNLPVYCVMDLGRNDYTVLTFFQVYRNSVRIIHEYWNTGVGLKHYAEKFFEFKAQFKWNLEEIGLPHDCVVVDLSEETNRNRQEILHDYGVTNTVPLTKQSVQTGIELVRELIPFLWIDEECSYLHTCFLRFTKKWNDARNIWEDEPKKNEYKHGADTIRYMAQYLHENLHYTFSAEPPDTQSNSDGSQADGIAL